MVDVFFVVVHLLDQRVVGGGELVLDAALVGGGGDRAAASSCGPSASTLSIVALPPATSIFSWFDSRREEVSARWVSPVITSLTASLERKVATARSAAITATISAAWRAKPGVSSSPPAAVAVSRSARPSGARA